MIAAADQRYARLWQDEQDLRRSLLTARKLAGYLAPDLVERVVEELTAMGYPPVRAEAGNEDKRSIDHVARTLGL